MKRTKLKDRTLPDYSRGEELMNTLTHIAGAVMGIVALVLCILEAASKGNVWGVVGSGIYGASLIALYSVSSVYHGMKPGMGKKVMQVIDHCTIYLLIAGTYTPILLSAIRPEHPFIAWTIFGVEWGIVAMAAVFTAIDHNKFKVLSMTCYVGLGWCIMLALKPTIECIGIPAFIWLISGGIAYTIGAVLYGIGGKKPIYHTVFHVFTDLGSILQAVCIIFYIL
jgi:hemolysin III